MKRLPFIDDARFFCTILMVAYHASISFMKFDSPLWPAHDIYGNLNFDFIVLLLRWSRMPIVFFVSGLSAGLLFKKCGAAPYLRNRWRKIYLPMILAAIMFLPLVSATYGYGFGLSGSLHVAPAHLWFLIYLLPMYLLPLVATERMKEGARHGVRFLLKQFWILPLISPVTFCLILPMQDWLILDHAIFEILPKPSLFLYYAVFFTFGWAISLDIELLNQFTGHRRFHFLFMLIAAGLLLFSISNLPRHMLVNKDHIYPLILLFSNNLLSWVSLYFWIGLFITISSKTHRFFKNVNASAYWVYLSHYPLVLFLQVYLADKEMNVYLKFALTFGGSLILCVAAWLLYARVKRAISAEPA